MLIHLENPDHLLETTLRLFMRYGIRSVSMDDVAREAGMSKKTIYLKCGDRNGLVNEVVNYLASAINSNCRRITSENPNAIDQLLQIGQYVLNVTRQINPNLFYEMNKYFPEAWQSLRQYRMDYVQQQIIANIETGIAQGVYRRDFDVQIVGRLYICLMDIILDENLFPKSTFTFRELQEQIILYHLHAIVTPEGLTYLNTQSKFK